MQSHHQTFVVLLLLITLLFTGTWIYYLRPKPMETAYEFVKESTVSEIDAKLPLPEELTLEGTSIQRIVYEQGCTTGCKTKVEVFLDKDSFKYVSKSIVGDGPDIDFSCEPEEGVWDSVLGEISTSLAHPMHRLADPDNTLGLFCSDQRPSSTYCLGLETTTGGYYELGFDAVSGMSQLTCADPKSCTGKEASFFELTASNSITKRYYYDLGNDEVLKKLVDIINDLSVTRGYCAN